MRLYELSYGGIAIGNTNLSLINLRWWRDMCGVVMQDGCIFSDTIRNNIVLSDEDISNNRLVECCRISQILDDIEQMPKGFDTLIGEKGRGLSDGQKQRLLIARALYRDPYYLFLDEATNSLDVINKKKINNALKAAFNNRTVVVVAHRLSAIRDADQIVVLDRGLIIEFGTHASLMEQKGMYYKLLLSDKT